MVNGFAHIRIAHTKGAESFYTTHRNDGGVRITSLEFKNEGIQCMQVMSPYCGKFLKKLTLAGPSPPTPVAVEQFLRDLTHLGELTLDVQLTRDFVEALVGSLRQQPHCNALKRIDIGWQAAIGSADLFFSSFRLYPQLEHLSLVLSDDMAVAQALITAMQGLGITSLTIDASRVRTVDGVMGMLREGFDRDGDAPALTGVEFVGRPFSGAKRQIADLLDQFPGLARVTLNEMSLDGDGCASLAAIIRDAPALMKLNLERCRICGDGGVALIEALENAEDLEELRLGGNPLQPRHIKSLAGVLRSTTHLVELSLWRVDIGASFLELAPALRKLQSLEGLNLKACSLGAVAAILADAIRALKLKRIDLTENYFDEEGLLGVVEAVVSLRKTMAEPLITRARLSADTATKLYTHLRHLRASVPVTEAARIRSVDTEIEYWEWFKKP